jgi:hypothetical protein
MLGQKEFSYGILLGGGGKMAKHFYRKRRPIRKIWREEMSSISLGAEDTKKINTPSSNVREGETQEKILQQASSS